MRYIAKVRKVPMAPCNRVSALVFGRVVLVDKAQYPYFKQNKIATRLIRGKVSHTSQSICN